MCLSLNDRTGSCDACFLFSAGMADSYLPSRMLVMERKDLCLKCLVYSRIAGETSSIELVDRDGMGGLTAAMFLVCIDATAPVEGIQTFV